MKTMSSTPRFFDETAAARARRVSATQLPHSQSRYNLLVVGTGMMGREHMRVASLLGRARVHGIFDTHAGSIEQALSEFAAYADHVPVVYEDLESACQDDRIDAILICSPNYTHFDVLTVAARSGKPLFVEKPMATRLVDAGKTLELAADYPGFIQLGMQYRYKSQYVDAFHAVYKENSLGAVKTIAMSEYRPPFLDKVGQWNKFNDYSGGTLVEKCCHYFDLINLMAGSRPERVFASGGQALNFLDFQQDGRRADIDDHAFVIIDYATGIRASFTLNMFSRELYEELIVTGEQGRLLACEHSSFTPGSRSRGTIQVETQGHPAYSGIDVTYPDIIEASGHHGATFFEHEALVDRLQGKATDAATPLQGIWAMIVASAAQQSIVSGEIVTITDFLTEQGLAHLLAAAAD